MKINKKKESSLRIGTERVFKAAYTINRTAAPKEEKEKRGKNYPLDMQIKKYLTKRERKQYEKLPERKRRRLIPSAYRDLDAKRKVEYAEESYAGHSSFEGRGQDMGGAGKTSGHPTGGQPAVHSAFSRGKLSNDNRLNMPFPSADTAIQANILRDIKAKKEKKGRPKAFNPMIGVDSDYIGVPEINSQANGGSNFTGSHDGRMDAAVILKGRKTDGTPRAFKALGDGPSAFAAKRIAEKFRMAVELKAAAKQQALLQAAREKIDEGKAAGGVKRVVSAVMGTVMMAMAGLTAVAGTLFTGLFILLSVLLTVVIVIALLIFIITLVLSAAAQYLSSQTAVFYDDVMAYEETIAAYCEDEGIGDYTYIVLSVMQVATGGYGTDPMAASEFVFNEAYVDEETGQRAKIQEADYSCMVGVKELAALIKSAGVSGTDDADRLLMVYQAYHFEALSRDYLSLEKKAGAYSGEEARAFIDANIALSGKNEAFAEEVAALYQSYLSSISADAGSGEFIWPLWGKVSDYSITSSFGWRICPFHGRELHPAIDIAGNSINGRTVYASKGGHVTTSAYNSSFGNYIVIDHGDGTCSQYNHLQSRTVSSGETVYQGQAIGAVGSTGDSTGPHLDFRIFMGSATTDNAVNPLEYVDGGLNYSEAELTMVAKLLYREAGADYCSDEEQMLVVSVLVNRMRDPAYPDTLRGVIYQAGQYAPAINGTLDSAPVTKRCKTNAQFVLDHGPICPADVIYQHSFSSAPRFGSRIYKSFNHGSSTEWFECK